MIEEKPCELADLPAEMQQILVTKCDFITRCKLRASSVSMKDLVASTKLFIPHVKVKEIMDGGVFVKLTIKLFKDEYALKFKRNATGGTRICQDFKNDTIIADANPVDEAITFFERMCLQNNITIGQLQFEGSENSGDLQNKFHELMNKENMVLKIKSFYWKAPGPIDLFWKIMEVTDKNVLKELKVVGDAPNGGFTLFGNHDKILNDLEKIEVECDTNGKDENIRSLKASSFTLKSSHFTPDLASHLIEKFTTQLVDGSHFQIEATPDKEINSCVIPHGFERVDGIREYTEYSRKLPEGNTSVVHLRVSETSVRLQVTKSQDSNIWDQNVLIAPPDYDDDLSEYDIYDDFDDLENDYYGNGFDTDPDYDFYAQRGFHESDFDDDEDDESY